MFTFLWYVPQRQAKQPDIENIYANLKLFSFLFFLSESPKICMQIYFIGSHDCMLRHTLEMLEIIFGYMPLFSIFFRLFLFWCIGPLQKSMSMILCVRHQLICYKLGARVKERDRERVRESNVINMTRKQHHTDTNVRIEWKFHILYSLMLILKSHLSPEIKTILLDIGWFLCYQIQQQQKNYIIHKSLWFCECIRKVQSLWVRRL